VTFNRSVELIYEKQNNPGIKQNPEIMKRNITKISLINWRKQQDNLSVLTVNEMINIKGGGKPDTNDPPYVK
jgi:hypothetical protein